MSYPVPDDVLARHIAVVGETGSGKTFDTKSIVEHLVEEGHRVCVLDTIKSDWWGMISSASGKLAGLPFRIIGGPRGHVPLHAGAGKALGELVAKGKLPLSIIDMADFDMGEPQSFFVDFAKALWKNIKGVLYLVIEEAHEIAPKERVGAGKENMSVYWAKRLATGSRTKGLRLIVATQRTQALHNAVLGSCGALTAHSLSLPADQKPVIDWLTANLRDKDLLKAIQGELAFLPTGTAWVCCAKSDFFKKLHFPPIKTFDNTATPDKDADDFDVTTAAVDPEELKAIIGDAVKEAEENDPARLKGQIARLTAALEASKKTYLTALQVRPPAVVEPDPEALASAREEGVRHALITMDEAMELQHVHSFAEGAEFGRGQILYAVRNFTGPTDFKFPNRKTPPGVQAILARAKAPQPATGSRRAARQVQAAPAAPASRPPAPAARGPAREPQEGGLKGSQLHLLKTLRWWEAMGHPRPSRNQVAAVAGWGKGHLKNIAGSLSAMGLISYPGDSVLALTDQGRAAAPEPDMGASLIDGLRSTLKGTQQSVLDLLLANGRVMTRQDMGRKLGWGAGHLKNIVGSMSALEIVSYPAEDTVELQDWVQ